MELRHLRYFVAVAEALSYRRAAQIIRVAQPALSKQIKDLEHEVGARLLERDTGGVMLTDAGAVLLEEAKDILERVEMAARAAREAESGRSGRLTVGSLGAVSASFLPATLAAFRTRFPLVEIALHEAPGPDQIHALQSGLIQVGFTVDEAVMRAPDLDSLLVFSSRLVVALSPDHWLAGRSTVSLADLGGDAFYCVGGSERHSLHQKLTEGILAARGIRHRPVKRVNGYDSLVALVSGGHGVSLLLPFASAGRSGNVMFREIKEHGDDLVLHLRAIWLNRGRSQLVRNFVETLREHSPSGIVRQPPRQNRRALL